MQRSFMLVFLAPASNAVYRCHFVADEKGRIFLYCTISDKPFPEIKAPDEILARPGVVLTRLAHSLWFSSHHRSLTLPAELLLNSQMKPAGSFPSPQPQQ